MAELYKLEAVYLFTHPHGCHVLDPKVNSLPIFTFDTEVARAMCLTAWVPGFRSSTNVNVSSPSDGHMQKPVYHTPEPFT